MKIIILVLLSLALNACTKPSSSEAPVPNFNRFVAAQTITVSADCDERCVSLRKEFRYVAYVGEKMYCYWNEKQKLYGMDFKNLAVGFENQITTKTSDSDYFLILYRWASTFRDGHVGPMLRDDLSEIEFYTPSVRFEMIAPGTDHEALIISQVGDDVTKLKVGYEVDTIQGQAWKDLAVKADAYTLGSTERMRRRQIGNLIFRALLDQQGPKPVKIQAHSQNVMVEETVARNLSFYAPAPAAAADTGIANVKSAILANNIGYLRIDGFSGTNIAQLLEQGMDRLATTSGLLLDVRKNGGGDMSGNVVLERLISENKVRYYQSAIRSDFLFALRPEVSTSYIFVDANPFSEKHAIQLTKSKKAQYSKPVMLLTSPNCFSACDTFSSGFKQNKLGLVLGESTGGGTGTPQVFELPVSGHKFRYSVIQGFTAVNQEYIEGQGTVVDHVIEPTVAERLEKKDRQLETALQMLTEQVDANQPVVVPPALLNLSVSTDVSKPLEIERDQEFKQAFER